MVGPIVKNYNKRTHKKCIKCRAWKAREHIIADEPDEDGNEVILEKSGFGKHSESSDGLQSICHKCKNNANTDARNKNVKVRLRHHIATRCLTQLGELAPAGFTKELESYLGYRIQTLVRHLRTDLQVREGKGRKLGDALNEGYHVDHKKPLSLFKVILKEGSPLSDFHDHVDWAAFKECWAVDNLTAIPGEENLKKGATYDDNVDNADDARYAEEVAAAESDARADEDDNDE